MLTRHGDDRPRVVLHVGLPKSGTTFLQHALRRNAEALADRGVLYPQTADDVMFTWEDLILDPGVVKALVEGRL